MNSKIKEMITVFLIQLVLTLPFYTANVYGLTISNVKVTKVTSNSATIGWNTDNASNGRVKYGKTTALGFTQRHDNFVENHTVTVSNGIDSDTTYFFAVESTDLAGNTAIDSNSNNFYTFKTADITPPPQVTGLKASVTQNSVLLSWNSINASDLDYYIIYKDRVNIATVKTNSFKDLNVNFNADISYKVSAVDKSGNEGSLSDTVIITKQSNDTAAPVISGVDVLPVSDTTAKVTWLTDEKSTSVVLYGVNKTDKVKESNELITNHSIVIDALTKNLNYFFIVKSCDIANNCANASGKFGATGKDTTPPFINLSIPRFINRRMIDIIGSTEPFTSVTLFVNNMNVPKRSLSNNEVGSSGKFVFSQVQLTQDNIIKVVFVDKSGNKNEKTFEVSIDTEDPIVQLNEVPSLTSKSNLTISGSVNEPVTIKVFVDANVNESSAPSKITGLNTTKVGQNSVELKWDESKDKDFSHYVVYREDAGPIALTKPANFNLFIDALVDSGKDYTYQVSAVNIFAREGPKSEPITVKTLTGGQILNLKPPEVDIFEDFRKPLMVTNASGSFNFGIKLDKGDGAYKIKLTFEDRADNSVIIEKSVTLDTKKPDVKIISPPSGAFIFENVANEVDVVGKTEPNARVHLFVDRTPFSFYNETFEISGLPNEIQNLPEAQLDAKCRSAVSTSFCRTGADFSVTADSQGNFKFERVDLTAVFGGAARVREVPVTEFRDTQLNPEAQESKKTTLVVIATDQVGQRGFATQTVNIGTCWSGNQSWDIIPLTQYQSPTFLSAERLAEGTETIYFYFNYSYIGRGTDAKITDVSLSKACSSKEIVDPRFNISCQIIPSSNSPVKLNKPDNTLSYSAVTLSRFPGMDRFLENDWKSFFKAINNEFTFPFKVRITYKHKIIDDDGTEKEVAETQTTCEQVTYVVDNTLIDPRKVLPDWLLYDFVDFLQDSIKTITKVQEQINKLLDYVAIGCMTSFVLNFVLQSARRIATFLEEKSYAALNSKTISQLSEWTGIGKIKLNPEKKEYENDCRDIIEKIVKKHGSFKFKYVNDIDLKRCFPNSAAWWDRESTAYSWLRWSCDRVFGHASPSAWTEKKEDGDLIIRIQSGEGCAVDQSVRGQPLKAEKCRDLVASSFPQLPKDAYNLDDKCFKVEGRGKRALFKLSDQVEGPLYKVENPVSVGEIKIDYVLKKNEFDYTTAQSQTCEEICGIKKEAKRDKLKIEGQNVVLVKGKGNSEIGAYCTTANTCISLNAKVNKENKNIVGESGGIIHKVESAERRGFTSDCFYHDGDSVDVVSNNPEQREECCCINAKEGPPSKYYQPDDYDLTSNDPAKKVHESKSKPLEPPQRQPEDEKGYSDMDWSYRYWKEKFEAKGTDGNIHKEYNPNRYIKGRDLPACFGQDNLLYEAFGEEEKVLTVDPFKQHEAALQCLHLAGISNRLQFIKNLMASMSTCLIQVRTTGRGDAGACKELFSQYLCGAIWQLIRWFVDGCAPIGLGIDFDTQSDTVTNYLRAGFKGVYESIGDLQSSITQEYGNAKLNELLGTGEESIVRKICLGAFGYDWEFNVRNLVDAAYATPFATLVQPITKSREFLTVDPVSLKPKYEYRASWLINPGCDFERYDVYLSCVGQKQLNQYPNSVNCGAIGAPSIAYTGALGTSVGYSQCDCINLPDEKPGPSVFSGILKQNVLEEREIPSGQRVQESNYRYDHLKFVLRPDRKITPKIKPNCFPQGYDDGVFYFPIIDKTARDIADCTLDYLSGLYTCGGGTAFFSRKGTAELIEVTINGENANKVKELSIGDRLEVGARVTKTGQDKCLRVSISPDPIQPVYTGITLNGTNDVAPIRITDELRIASRRGDVIARGISYSLRAQNNKDIVTISIKAFDDTDKNKPGYRLYSEDDKVVIDGHEIKFDTEEQQGDAKTKIKVSNKIITVEKEDAIIEIKDITYPQTQVGTYELQEIITINPPQQVAQTSQSKTIIVELFHLKEDRDSYNNPDDCSLNEKIVERKYTITISQGKGIEASKLGPVIQNPTINPRSPIAIGQKISISSRITHAEGILDTAVSITGPDGQKVFEEPQSMGREGDNFELIFETDGKEKGKYKGNIKATSRTNTVSNKAFEFELK